MTKQPLEENRALRNRHLRSRVIVPVTVASTGMLLMALAAGPALAVTITVDEVTCTLVDAVDAANTDTAVGGCSAGSGADTLNLQANVTLTVELLYMGNPSQSGTPYIESDITVDGNGFTIARSLSSPDRFRLFTIAPWGNFTLNDATLTGGNEFGAAVTNYGGTMAINDSTITGNSTGIPGYSGLPGGAVYNYRGGTATIQGTTISNNWNIFGGGVVNEGTMTIDESTISGNSAANVGGIRNQWLGILTITNSTISGNTATDAIGAISNEHVATIANSTISGNSANRGGGIISFGANVPPGLPPSLTLINNTITDNTSTDTTYAAGLDGDPVSLTNTIVANQALGDDCGTAGWTNIISNGNNLDSDNTCNLTQPSDLPNTNPLLGALANNGGPTQTHALLAGSPAINAGDIPTCTMPPVSGRDQRGGLRAFVCDIGAYQFGAFFP